MHENILRKVQNGVITELQELPVLHHASSLATQIADQIKDADQTVALLDFLNSSVDDTKSSSAANAIAEKRLNQKIAAF